MRPSPCNCKLSSAPHIAGSFVCAKIRDDDVCNVGKSKSLGGCGSAGYGRITGQIAAHNLSEDGNIVRCNARPSRGQSLTITIRSERRTRTGFSDIARAVTLALIVGLIIVNILQPGAGMNVDARTIDTKSIQICTTKAGQQGTVEFLMHIIPNTVVGTFAEGEILQVLFFAILFAFGLFMLGERGRPVLAFIDIISHTFFGIVGIIMKAAPIGAFGAMAFTVGKYGAGTLLSLAQLMIAFYITCVCTIRPFSSLHCRTPTSGPSPTWPASASASALGAARRLPIFRTSSMP